MFSLNRKKRNVKAVWAGMLPDHVIDLGWSADGRYLAAAASTGSVTIFDAKAGTGDVSLPGHVKGTLALAWSPTEPRLATAGKDRRVRMWDVTGREVAQLEAASNWVEHLAWHPNGTMLAAASGRAVYLWTNTGEHIIDLEGHPSTVSDIAWKPNTDTISCLVYGGVMHWNIQGTTAQAFKLFPWKGSPLKMAWSPNAVMLAHGNQDSTVHFWYAETAEELQMSGFATKVRELSWDSTSRYLATGGSSVVCVWDCGGEGPAGRKPQLLEGHAEDSTLSVVQYQKKGQLLASGATDGRVCVWQPQNAKQPLLATIESTDGEVTQIRWSPDERLLAVGYESGVVRILSIS